MEYSNIDGGGLCEGVDYEVEEAVHEDGDEVYDFAIRFADGSPLYFKMGEGEGEVMVCAKRRGFDYYRNYLEMPSGRIVIPSEVVYRGAKYRVTEIGGHAFHNCTKVVEVRIPDTVERIGEFAFFFCVSLREVRIPDSVSEIGGFAFESCQSLQGVVLPKGLKRISKSMFCGSELCEITIPEGVEEIEAHAFHGCEHLGCVRIPKSVERIGDKAFVGCVGLREVQLENGDVELGEEAFPEGVRVEC